MTLRIASLFLICGSIGAAVLPVGTELDVRLTSDVSSDRPSGQPVRGVITAPVYLNGAAVLAAGVQVQGNTADANPYRAAEGSDSPERPATLRIQLTDIIDRSGQAHPLYSVLTGVDNAREAVDASGLITGISSSDVLESQIDRGLNKLQSRYQQLAQILEGVKGALVKDVDTLIDFRQGVDLTFKLTRSFEWTSPAEPDTVRPITPQSSLIALVRAQPIRTVAQSPPEPSDLTNLMFIGSAEQLESAFHEAGWFPADALSRSSKMETARAIIEDRGYNEAPMSVLYLDARPPEFAFQKQTDTFAMRHHIRIWRRPQMFAGEPVWIAAATHDISISFSPVSRSFTHKIDSNIDLERSKVVKDLLFTGHVQAIALVERNGIFQGLTNATGDTLISDGKIAVLEF